MVATYFELEKLNASWQGDVCIFGAGYLGSCVAYELLRAAGFNIDFYCDNGIPQGTIIRDEIKVEDNQYLYDNREHVLVFLCIPSKYHNQVLLQLRNHGVKNIIIMDIPYISQVMDSVDRGDDIVKEKYHAIYDDIEFLSKTFKKKVGYDLNITNPRTFNEKIQWLKVFNHNDDYTSMVDKYAVKEIVSEKVGNKYVVPTLGVWEYFDEIDFEKLPDKFVLKCTHDSGSVILVETKANFNYEEAKRKLELSLNTNYYWRGREWPYKNVPRRILAEQYMASPCDMTDYKFLCFNGNPKVLFTCTERFNGDGLKVTFFDLNWNRLNFERHYPSSAKEISRPKNLNLMIELAEQLSEGIPFVRVDFYEIEDKVYFGEMTFFPGGGMEEFRPVEWDYTLGEWIEL